MSRDNSNLPKQGPALVAEMETVFVGLEFHSKVHGFCIYFISREHITPLPVLFGEKFTLKRKICNDRSLPNANSHAVVCKLKRKAVVCNGFPLCYFVNLKFSEPLKGFVMALIKKSVPISFVAVPPATC